MASAILSNLPRWLAVCSFGLFTLAATWSSPAATGDVAKLAEEGQRACDAGNFSRAADQWEQALKQYHRKGNPEAEVHISAALAGAYQAIGQHRRSVETLEAALALAESKNLQSRLPFLKGRLGAALIMTREYERAGALLNDALTAAKAVNNRDLEGDLLNDLGNLCLSQQRLPEALTYYDAAAANADQTGNTLLAAQARCNAASAAVRSGELSRADKLNAEALERIGSLSASHTKGFLLLTAGQTDLELQPKVDGAAGRLMLRAHQSFDQALGMGRQLEDRSVETYALGYLAEAYEQDRQPGPALALARRAIFAAQECALPEALYRWEWQQGRLLKAMGDSLAAIAAYRRAIQTLQPIRADVSLGFGNANRQQSFREAQGPLFLQLADLLLAEARSAKAPEVEQALLREARDIVEHLKSVELNDYFCDDCVEMQRARTLELERVDEHTAVVYLIPLPTRTEILVGFRSGLRRVTADVTAQELTARVTEFRRNLETRTSYAYLAEARQLYDWLIRPLQPWFREHEIDTLVFVPDGALRTIPFASLHDGEHFLIEDLAVAVAPGLSLVAPRALAHGKARVLLSGLSESVQGFPALDFVPDEMHTLGAIYPGETLLNRGFTLGELKRKLGDEQFSIVHIASHGQFDRDVRKTFVLTYDGKLTLNGLEALIRPSQYRGQPVELLVLSACQTAAGDDRAALGLAGVALKAGARSALGSLWFVNDQSTSALISQVYEELRRTPAVSKARALQAAQIKLLKDRRYRHPCYWSPFLIIGNWL